MTAREGDGIEAVLHKAFHEAWAGPSNELDLYADSPIWTAQAAALRASAPDDGLRAAVEALADEWQHRYDAGDHMLGCPDGSGYYDLLADELRALLADQPPTQPEGDDHA